MPDANRNHMYHCWLPSLRALGSPTRSGERKFRSLRFAQDCNSGSPTMYFRKILCYFLIIVAGREKTPYLLRGEIICRVVAAYSCEDNAQTRDLSECRNFLRTWMVYLKSYQCTNGLTNLNINCPRHQLLFWDE